MKEKVDYHKLARILVIIGILILVLRLLLSIALPFLANQGGFWLAVMMDSFHHYHFGFLLVLIVVPIYFLKRDWVKYVFAFGIAFVVEEYLVIIYEIIYPFGYDVPFVYLSTYDNLVVLSIGIAFIMLGILVENRNRRAVMKLEKIVS